MLTDLFGVGKFDYGVTMQYQNLTRKPELFRAPLGPGPGAMYPLNPPLAGPAYSPTVKLLEDSTRRSKGFLTVLMPNQLISKYKDLHTLTIVTVLKSRRKWHADNVQLARFVILWKNFTKEQNFSNVINLSEKANVNYERDQLPLSLLQD